MLFLGPNLAAHMRNNPDLWADCGFKGYENGEGTLWVETEPLVVTAVSRRSPPADPAIPRP